MSGTVALLGGGNVAWSLAKALAGAGYRVAQVWSRGEEHAREVAARCGATPLHGDGALRRLTRSADIYILSVRDDALAPLAAALAGHAPGALWVHTAGSVPLSALSPLGPDTGVVYPLQTFTRGREVDFSRVPLFVEGAPGAMALARSISAKVVEAHSELRRRLHLAAVFACNFACRLWAVADDLLRPDGLDFGVMAPLVEEMLRKAEAIGPARAQTGPAARADMELIASQRQALADPLQKEIYDVITRSILQAREL